MESYVVRIYRRVKNSSRNILGIVEKPDIGMNRTFRNFEELYGIFFPSETALKTKKQKQILEQRKFRRFAIKEGTLTFGSTTDVGEIEDLSMGGLSFNCSNVPEDSVMPLEVSILCGDRKIFVENIQCRKIISRNRSKSPALSEQQQKRTYSIEFADLTPSQNLQLKDIIQNHTLGEA